MDLARIVELATALGNTADAAKYSAYRATLIDAFNAGWLNADGSYGNTNGDGLQTANAAAIAVSAASASASNAAISAALANDVANTHSSHWVTGIIGMRFLHAALTSIGEGVLAVSTLLNTDYPSFGWSFDHPDEPATTRE